MLVFVHRYKWGHSPRRKQLRRLKKEGVVKVIEETRDGWLYSCPNKLKIKGG